MAQLPYELWLRVLESISHEHILARPAYVNCFVKAIIRRRATEQELVASLPDFELRAWKATRPYYAVSSKLRKAAQQVFLTGVLLQTCRAPLEEVPRKRKGKKAVRGVKRDRDGGPFYAPDVLARLRARESEDGTDIVPTYLPLEVFGELMHPEFRVGSLGLAITSWELGRTVEKHIERIEEDHALLRTVRKVELLAASPYEGLTEAAWEHAEKLKRRIEKVWEDLMVEDGEVRIML